MLGRRLKKASRERSQVKGETSQERDGKRIDDSHARSGCRNITLLRASHFEFVDSGGGASISTNASNFANPATLVQYMASSFVTAGADHYGAFADPAPLIQQQELAQSNG